LLRLAEKVWEKVMRIHELSPAEGSRKKRKRVGRGPGSGHGKTSCRGHKGQKSRSGGGPRPGFEGGQMPLQRRLPKRGFNNIFKKSYSIVNIKDLSRFAPNSSIDSESLRKAGLVKKERDGIKLLGNGEISHPLVIQVHKVSKTAKEKIEASGGKVEVLL
jgi:large subunit ribosomal protein L15